MIRPLSGGTMPSTEFVAPAESAADPVAMFETDIHALDTYAPPTHAYTADATGKTYGNDPMAKLYDLIGAAPHPVRLYADNGVSPGAQSGRTDALAGAELPGQKGVLIQRSLGDPRGYDTRNHALAWARAMGSDTAMVVLGNDRRWHAVQTNKPGADANGGTGRVVTAIQVGKVDPAVYDRLKKDAMEKNDPEKWKTFAAYALGVPRNEINIVREGDAPSLERVNINLTRNFDAEGKTAGFDPKKPPWVQLGPAAFDRPANACATLAHEEVHADHHRLAQPLYAKYQAYLQDHPKSKESFRMWAANEASKTAARDKADPQKVFAAFRRADIVAGMQDGSFGATELEAHIEAAKLAFASGDLVQARTDLGKVSRLPTMPTAQAQEVSIAVLKDLRASLSGSALEVFDETAKKARDLNVLRDSRLRPH
jgi:hypothetical protein